MSSFRWGMIACPTPRNSQVTARKAGAIPFSNQIWIVFLTVLHSEVWLISASIPLHFGLSLCNPLEQISPLCAIWKGTYMAFNWGIKAWSAPRGCIAIKLVNDLSSFASYILPKSFGSKPLLACSPDMSGCQKHNHSSGMISLGWSGPGYLCVHKARISHNFTQFSLLFPCILPLIFSQDQCSSRVTFFLFVLTCLSLWSDSCFRLVPRPRGVALNARVNINHWVVPSSHLRIHYLWEWLELWPHVLPCQSRQKLEGDTPIIHLTEHQRMSNVINCWRVYSENTQLRSWKGQRECLT